MHLPIFFINRSMRTDRRVFMEEQFERLGLEAERVEAVEADSEQVLALVRRFGTAERPNGLSASELACSLSHELIWKAALARKQDLIAVFEDDAILSGALPEFLTSTAASPYDVVHLESEDRRLRVLPTTHRIAGIEVRPYISTLHGSAGYLISSQAMATMLETSAHRRIPVDHALFCPLRSPIARRALTDPGMCIQLSRGSSRGSVAQSNIVGSIGRKEDSFGLRLYLMWLDIRRTGAHLANLPRGVERKYIGFELAEDRGPL